jgi:4-hydroxy-tetrahydrodipicolinate synthase
MRFQGIYTPIITPFSADGSVDWDAYAEVIEQQIESGVAGIIAGGSTGEFYAMSKQERIQQFEFAAERIKDRVEFMAGVNDMRVDQCLEFSLAARTAGAQSLLVAAPPYSLPSETELAAHVLKIEQAAGLPIMLYNYPGRTGVEMGETFLSLVADNANVAGIKESSGDVNRIHLLVNHYPQIELVAGAEDQVLEFFVWGAKAWVCASGNMFAAECVRFLDLVANQGDFERGKRIMAAFSPLMHALEQGGKFIQSVKYASQMQGIPAGNVRPPMLPLDAELENELRQIVNNTRSRVNAILDEMPGH